MSNNKELNNTDLVTYAFVIKATKEGIVRINEFLDSLGCKVIFQKSSNLKLFIKEEMY